MVARNTWNAVGAIAQLLARASGPLGQSAVQLVVEAANLELTPSRSQPPMEAMNAHTRINTQKTALATKISAALWTAKDHGVALTSALNSARIAVVTVQLEHNRRPSLSLWRLNVVVSSALQNTVKFSSEIAMNIAAHRIAKVLGVSMVSALLHVAMETKRRPTPSPIRLLLVARNAHIRTLASTPKLATTCRHAPFIARVSGTQCGAIATHNVVSTATRAPKRSTSLNSSGLNMVEMRASSVMSRPHILRNWAQHTSLKSV